MSRKPKAHDISGMQVNWKSYYEAGAISREELQIARSVERFPQKASEGELRFYYTLRARHGLLNGMPPPRNPITEMRASSGDPVGDDGEALTQFITACNEVDRPGGLKSRLCIQILLHGKDYRREWNRMLGFEMFKIKGAEGAPSDQITTSPDLAKTIVEEYKEGVRRRGSEVRGVADTLPDQESLKP